MTADSGARSHHSAGGQNRRAIQVGTAIATSQKNGAIAPTTTKPKN